MAFRICSGQGRKHDRWSVCCDDGTFPIWWRPMGANGRERTFATPEAADRFMRTLSVQGVAHSIAKDRAAIIREYASRGKSGWEALHRYPLMRAVWAYDPFGLYTSDIVAPM